jgi:hypothetical protein
MKARLLLVLLAGASTLASAEARAEDVASPAPAPRPDRHEVVARFELGYRGSFITTPGYNPFSTNDYLPQVSIGVTRTLASRGPFSFASGVAWDYATTGATSLGDTTSLTFHRLTAILEGRLHFRRWGYAFVRGAPGVAYESVEIDDPSVPGSALTKSRWLFAADLSAGYALPLWTRTHATQALSSFWAQADGGYGLVANQELNLTPNGQTRTDGVDLGALALRGAFFRLALAASF